MDIVRDLAVLDLLCVRDFPTEHGSTEVGCGGPGYFLVPLGPVTWPSPEDLYAYEVAMTERLDERLGSNKRWGATTLRERLVRGEEIAQPWAKLGVLADDLRTWSAGGTGRWITLTVSDREDADSARLLAAVTDVEAP
ncbi:hypothetical protein [Streptomyces gilvus]|uniref:hypothetical protein n=1 Tax=Streptomyces gilvus TaxID=2920937 RepID=UPI001F104AAB|nr:hypothetical protein [Streptomyces sp. CME 23]MCH5674525.1 hypothetical protein [Streptomyces sp. CME 23]